MYLYLYFGRWCRPRGGSKISVSTVDVPPPLIMEGRVGCGEQLSKWPCNSLNFLSENMIQPCQFRSRSIIEVLSRSKQRAAFLDAHHLAKHEWCSLANLSGLSLCLILGSGFTTSLEFALAVVGRERQCTLKTLGGLALS